ncbi:amidohydrolase family protein [Thermogymnomonas acidicola]|uniref:amidohydrolase family protein n=1 Tax=Thermogymnomonas acidicola TaxID=399579 RepID=UPI000946280A|nr:amidohydrolase family protein [Thermogymnomonas acidicola]
MQAIILGRPSSGGDESLEHVISMCDGLALSAISDVDPALLDASRDACRRMGGKLFAIHFNEDRREDLELLLSLEPDFIVHGIQCTKDEMKRLADAGIPVAITPRSNIFYGKRPDYSAFLDSGVTLMLGTDNAMVSEPDMFSEMDFLYRYQRGPAQDRAREDNFNGNLERIHSSRFGAKGIHSIHGR